MKIWDDIQSILNNREIALLIWILIIVLVILIFSRKSITRIIRSSINRLFLIIYSFIGAYLFCIIIFLKNIGVWEIIYLKDIIFWFFSVGLILVFKINDVKNGAYFKDIFFSAIKWTILLEFVVNLYSFNLVFEIIILPFFVILIATQTYDELYGKEKDVSRFLQNIVGIAILSIFIYSLYKTIVNLNDILIFKNLIAFLLPSAITILFIPFLYMLALYVIYEDYFIRLDFMTIKDDKVREVKKLILKTANINLDKLFRIKKKFEKKVFYDNTNLKEYIKVISKKSNDNI